MVSRLRLLPSARPLLTALFFSTLLAAPGVRGLAQQPPPPAAADFTLPNVETRVLGQRTWLRGGPASLRIIVTDHKTGRPEQARVSLALGRLINGKPEGGRTSLFFGATDAVGTLDASFHAPAYAPGPYEVTIRVQSKAGSDTVTQPITLAESEQILLTCDKPLYQPGQTVHLRALAIDASTHAAVADRPVTFEVEDARGNKVFKKRDTLSKFGIAGAEFILADEVNMGTFTLRAILPDGQVEKKVRVERYVLPKFKLEVTTDKPYYLPGEEVRGTVKARYFFGKPVADGAVTVTVNTIDVGLTKLTELKGVTSPIGAYTFRYTLPNSFVGQPFEQGKAVVEFDATLKDTADHRQEANASVPVVKEPIQLVLVPEHRTLVPHVENRVFIAAATPDGQPLRNAELRAYHGAPLALNAPGDRNETTLKTDEFGLAVYSFTPDPNPYTLTVETSDARGNRAVVTRTLEAGPGQEGIILRSDKTLAKVGDRLSLAALSSTKGGTLYLDVIRNKQTILTQAEPMTGGEAHATLPLTHDMVGTIEVNAYKILPNEDIIRDTRVIVVSPANDLNVQVEADKAEYRPGGDAVFHFTVTDAQKHPVLAALGLAMVDESVFALSELQPGLEKIYFTLEKELMEPKYEIHGLKPTFLMMQPGGPAGRDQNIRQRAATMLLCAAPEADAYEVRVDSYMDRWAKVEMAVVQRMQQTCRTIQTAVQRYHKDTGTTLKATDSLMLLVNKGYLREADLLDPWGQFYKSSLGGNTNYENFFTISSAGPDGKWATNDDIAGVWTNGWMQNGMAFGRRGGAFRDGPQGMVMNGALAAAPAGGRGFGGGGGRPEFAAAEPFMDRAAAKGDGGVQLEKVARSANRIMTKEGGQAGGSDAPRVREYFPETMLWNPMLITDADGHAELRVPMADSITTWRMSMMANTAAGQLGSATSPVKVFQEFFVDIDLPTALTQNDRVQIPVSVYNYLPTAQEVTLSLDPQPWFTLTGSATQHLKIDAGQVKVVYYPILVNAIGNHALTVTAKGSRLSDAVRRKIDVLPNGKMMDVTINDRLEHQVEKSVTVPEDAVKGATALWVKLYPGTFSSVVEGLDGVLRMPNGCFEQTSSSTYPDVLVLDYLKRTKRINPELQMKAEQYINVGYQRLVTFECKNGGFSWFGNEPAHQILTAYGLLEFSDMSKVHDVDPAVISRTQNWLANQQRADGSWEETGQGIAEGIINRQTGALRSTAYVAWALADSGFTGPQVDKGVAYVKAHLAEAQDPYTLAVILNLLAKVNRDSPITATTAESLIALAHTDDKAAWWKTDTKTFTGATAEGADLETSGLAAYGLLKWGHNPSFTGKVLTYLVQSKDAFGTWQSTQGTVWSMKSLLYATENASSGSKGTVTIFANGQKTGTIKITPEDSDVMRQVNLAEFVKSGANDIKLAYDGEGSLMYQIVDRYYMPWDKVDAPQQGFEPLKLDVEYDKKTLAQDDTATVTVTIHNTTDRVAEMPLIDVGVPPGFTVVPDDLETSVIKKEISKYTVAARQVILYLEKLDAGATLKVTYKVRAKYPIHARTPLSRAYPYYNPERVAVSAPQDIIVNK